MADLQVIDQDKLDNGEPLPARRNHAMNGIQYQPLNADVIELPLDELDTRTDDEIAQDFRDFRPVRQERNVWAFWDKGFSNLPPWIRRNMVGWVRRLGKRWDIRCVDMVEGSLNSVTRYIDSSALPDCLVTGNMDGQFSGPHASDLARLALVYHHGGVWLDAATMIFCDLDKAFWNLLEDPTSPYEMFQLHYPFRQDLGQCNTGFFAARKGNPFMQRWMKVFHELWKGRQNADGIHNHPLIRHLDPLSPTQKRDIGMGPIEGKNKVMMMDYLGLNFAFERVRLLNDPSTGWNGLEYFSRHVLLSDAIEEILKSYMLVPVEQQAQLLELPYEPHTAEQSERQKLVHRWMQELTTNCIAAKFCSSYWQPGLPIPLPHTWQDPANLDADIAPGTWAEYMRYASEHFTQRRMEVSVITRTQYIEGKFGTLFEGTLLEPIET